MNLARCMHTWRCRGDFLEAKRYTHRFVSADMQFCNVLKQRSLYYLHSRLLSRFVNKHAVYHDCATLIGELYVKNRFVLSEYKAKQQIHHHIKHCATT